MELQLVSPLQAVALKELGFLQSDIEPADLYFVQNEWCVAPTLELVTKWLREEKDIDLYARPCFEENSQGTYVKTGYTYEISMIPKEVLRTYSSPEEALSVGIDKAIEILKLNKNNDIVKN